MEKHRVPADGIVGLPITLDYFWLLLFVPVTGVLAINCFPTAVAGRPVVQYWVMAIAAFALLFASALVHELGHAASALQYAALMNA